MKEARPAAEPAPSRGPAREMEARSDPSFGRRPIKTSSHRTGARDDRTAIDRPAVRRSLRRAMVQLVLAVLVGVSGTLGWQSYGEEMLATHAPTLAWLFSISAAKVKGAVGAQSTPADANLEAVRRSLEQLTARQAQMAQDLAALQAIEDDIRQKMSFMPPSPASVPPAASVLQPRLPQPSAAPRAPAPAR